MLAIVYHIQVNTKATLMFSGMINDEIHESIMWPDLPYVTDGHGSKLTILISVILARQSYLIKLKLYSFTKKKKKKLKLYSDALQMYTFK